MNSHQKKENSDKFEQLAWVIKSKDEALRFIFEVFKDCEEEHLRQLAWNARFFLGVLPEGSATVEGLCEKINEITQSRKPTWSKPQPFPVQQLKAITSYLGAKERQPHETKAESSATVLPHTATPINHRPQQNPGQHGRLARLRAAARKLEWYDIMFLFCCFVLLPILLIAVTGGSATVVMAVALAGVFVSASFLGLCSGGADCRCSSCTRTPNDDAGTQQRPRVSQSNIYTRLNEAGISPTHSVSASPSAESNPALLPSPQPTTSQVALPPLSAPTEIPEPKRSDAPSPR